MKKETKNAIAISPARKRFFTFFLALIPIVFFGFVELGLQLTSYGGNLDLFIPAPGAYSDYLMCNPNVARRYFFMQSTIPDPQNDLFLKEKPENGYRVFALGGSTTAGYPYGNNVQFPRILQFRLQDVFPDRHIEVVNLGLTAVNTYTVLDFLDEILNKEPDALLIYAGHNEFYGALGAGSYESLGRARWFVKLYLNMQRSKVFLLMRDIVGALRRTLQNMMSDTDQSKPSATLMERMVAEQTIGLNSSLFELGKKQFQGNLEDIVTLARNAGVKVVLSELVSNVKDQKPFVSVKSEGLEEADAVYKQAVLFEKSGKIDKARELYLKAKDLDGLRFRAPEAFNEIVRDVASRFDVPFAPMRHIFENASPNAIIGQRLMLEHLHPNIDGYFALADGFFETMRQNGFIADVWDEALVKPSAFYREHWGFTELDAAYCDLRVRILTGGWPFKPKSAPNRTLLAYKPVSLVDSLAYKAWADDKTNLEHAHVSLAEYHEKRSDWMRAFREYRALVHLTPMNDTPYLLAADMLIKARQLEAAVPYLENVLKLENSSFANKWLGQIFLEKGQTKRALPYLEKAYAMAPDDAQIAYNLSGAYALSGQYDQARKTLAALEKISPVFPGAADLKRQLERL